MHSADIRQSYLDFFADRGHLIVPSSSLMPSSPNLLFTNSGMNQFVPNFLGERPPVCSRIADTQKCIRAGGKHNDLDDVGLDGYHHTFFEMLGNWSFGDYFKKEAIHWAWELLTKVWHFPKERLYATVYKPGVGDPADFDQESYDIWTEIFQKEGLDPEVHIVYGNRKNNFWMMGETGPCGSCTELHMDLTPAGDTFGNLVNSDSGWCIELWNLVFIEFNAEPDGTFTNLPTKHVDTGMGFERIAGILATTQKFTKFEEAPSNYNSDLFSDIFNLITKMSGIAYGASLPRSKNRHEMTSEEQRDCAFRVVADHIRTLTFAIADGILPGNEGRQYVLRRILRRAILFGKRLGLHPGFFGELVDPLVKKLGEVFPELRSQHSMIYKVISSEEESFERTLDRGLQELEGYFKAAESKKELSGVQAFKLYDTYGFPLDLTQIIADERGFKVDQVAFNSAMEEQRTRARAAQQKSVIRLSKRHNAAVASKFLGYDRKSTQGCSATLLSTEVIDRRTWVIFDQTPFYAQMGGQVGDVGLIKVDGAHYRITDTMKDESGRYLHALEGSLEGDLIGKTVLLSVDEDRRRSIERHHSVTHLLNWALRKVLGSHVMQSGSLVTSGHLRFDFTHFEAVGPEDLATIERLVHEKILENHPVSSNEIPFAQKPADVLSFFGDKYGEKVRIVTMGDFSKELCGGTHVEHTGEIGAFKIVSESGVSAGTRRIEAVAGFAAYQMTGAQQSLIRKACDKLACGSTEILKRIEQLQDERHSLAQQLRSMEQKQAAGQMHILLEHAKKVKGIAWVHGIVYLSNSEDLRPLAAQILGKMTGAAVVVLAVEVGDRVQIVAVCNSEANAMGKQAGTIVRDLCQKIGGKGGGKPDFAMAGAPANKELGNVLAELSQ
jgi:alanyl-tRNA synthetase